MINTEAAFEIGAEVSLLLVDLMLNPMRDPTDYENLIECQELRLDGARSAGKEIAAAFVKGTLLGLRHAQHSPAVRGRLAKPT